MDYEFGGHVHCSIYRVYRECNWYMDQFEGTLFLMWLDSCLWNSVGDLCTQGRFSNGNWTLLWTQNFMGRIRVLHTNSHLYMSC